MSGIARELVFNGADSGVIGRHLKALERLSAGNFAPVRREIGEFMLGNVQDNFDAQRLFDGTAMPRSKAAQGRDTKWGRDNKKLGRKKGEVRDIGKTLIDKHRLYDSYVYQLNGAGVEIGSVLIYAAIHHFGGETGHPKHRFQMLARPVLGVSAVQEAAIGDRVINALRALQ